MLKKNNAFIGIFQEIYTELGAAKTNFKFNFQNNIPFSRGLGSSSSVIVGAIAAAYHCAGFSVSREIILNKALKYESHPDNIAPATFGGFTTNIVHKGEVITQKTEIDPNLRAVVVIPDQAMNTKQSRSKLPKSYHIKDVVNNVSHAAFLATSFAKKDYSNLRAACIDKMHEDVRMSALPELFKVREIAYANGALMSTLSGSGSSFFNMTFERDAKRLKDIFEREFTGFKVEIYEFNNDGFYIES